MTTDYKKNLVKKPWQSGSTKPYLSNKTAMPWQKNQSTEKEEYTEQNTPSVIKNDIIERLGDKYGKLDVINAIDKVDDELIQKNISQAEDTIRTNIDTGRMSREEYTKYPAMRNGLAISYAAAESGNKKAEKLGREAAYTKWKNDTVPMTTQQNLDLTTKYDVNKLAKFNQRYAKKNDSQGLATLNTTPKNNNDLQGLTPVKTSLNNKDDTHKNDNKLFEWNTTSKELENATKRYVDATSLNMRDEASKSGKVVGNIKDGETVTFTGNKTEEEKDGHLWAEVMYNGKRGWVAADYLRTQPKQKYTKWDETPKIENNATTQLPNTIKKHGNPLDPSYVQKEFNNIGKLVNGKYNGDFDGSGEQQCPDIPKWYLNKFTTLSPVQGHGKYQVKNIADAYGLEISNIPSAPAIYSVDGNYADLGTRGNSNYGHTGVILDVQKTEDNKYIVTYIHTYLGLEKDGYISEIKTQIFTPNEKVTFVNIGDYMK